MTVKNIIHGYSAKKKKKNDFNLWNFALALLLLLGIIGVSSTIYQERTRQREIRRIQTRLQELQDQAQKQYQLQELNLISTNDLVNSPKIHSFFSDLLKTYTEKFAKIHSAKQSKGVNISHLPLKFEGFHLDKNTGNSYGKMGHCALEEVIYPFKQKITNISLNRLYLLNKLGHDRYFTSNPEISENYAYLDISFDKMIDTCSHELAHYIQFVKWGKSSCESDLILRNGNYSEELAKEHEKFTQEIYQLIKEDFSEWEKRWKEI